ETLLDVGCGDGLVAFGALERSETSRVIFSDVSQDMLDFCQEIVTQSADHERCEFIQASADDLSIIKSESADVVTTRSVLIYLKNKQACFDEFFRILKPGGRLSIFEPINSYNYPKPVHELLGIDATPLVEITRKVRNVFDALQSADDPMLDFDERDLVTMVEKSGFMPVHLELKIEAKPLPPTTNWNSMLNTAGNPKIPSLAEAMDQVLTATERTELEAYLRPRFEAGQAVSRMALAYLWAEK
ncbi:MAG: class I SAM-dependent methyltransferase, partial [Chloroflexota bacterium]